MIASLHFTPHWLIAFESASNSTCLLYTSFGEGAVMQCYTSLHANHIEIISKGVLCPFLDIKHPFSFWGRRNLLEKSSSQLSENAPSKSGMAGKGTSSKRRGVNLSLIHISGTPVPSGFEYRDVPSMLLGHGTTSDFPPPAHNIGRFAKEVESHGFVQGHVCCEFYPYDVKNSDVCCTLFTIYPKDINIRIAKKGR